MSHIGTNLIGVYDPSQISVWVAGLVISGFGEDVLRLVPREVEFFDDIGLDGELIRWPSNNYMADLIISLLPASPSNATLQSLLLADRLTGKNFFSIIIKDVGKTPEGKDRILSDTFILPLCWIKREPEVVYRKGIAFRDWPFVCALEYPILVGSGQLS